MKCDAETNPQDVIEAGQVVVEIGICPTKPAEFVIFRISQFAAGASEDRLGNKRGGAKCRQESHAQPHSSA